MAYTRKTITTSSRKRRPRRRYSRRPTRRRRVSRRRRAVRPRKIKLTRYALGQIDPFDDRVYGAKIPDANTTPSSTTCVNDEVVITTDALNQLGVKAFRPWLKSQVVSGTPTAGSTWTWTAAFGGTQDSSRISNVTGNFNLVRPVCHGIRLSCPLPPTSVTGFVHIALYCARDSQSVTTWDLPVSISQMNQCVWYKRYPLAMLTQRTLTVVNKITDCGSSLYVDPASDRAAGGNSLQDITLNNEGFCTIIVAAEAAGVSTSAVAVESITHYEALPIFTGVITPSPAAEFNPSELSGVSRIASVTDATMFDGEQDRRMAGAINAVLEGAHNYMGEVAGAVYDSVRNAAYNVGYSAARGAAGYAASYFGGGGIPGVTNPRLLQY